MNDLYRIELESLHPETRMILTAFVNSLHKHRPDYTSVQVSVSRIGEDRVVTFDAIIAPSAFTSEEQVDEL